MQLQKNDELCAFPAGIFYVSGQFAQVCLQFCGVGLLDESDAYFLHHLFLNRFKHRDGKLHCATMERAMLPDECAAVDADHFMLRKCLLQCLFGVFVVDGLVVGGHEHRAVDNEKVGICGRKPLAVLVIDGIGHGEGHQLVRLVLEGPERV